MSESNQIAPVYVIRRGEILLEAPIDVVWPHIVDYPSWTSYSVRELVAGRPGEEGEVIRLKKEEKGYSSPPFYARTVKIEPGRRILWKTYREAADGDEGYFGFVDFQLSPENGKTRFVSNGIYEFLVAYQDESELDVFRERRHQISETVFATTRAKLKQRVEGGGRS
jgi:hypothetical protein